MVPNGSTLNAGIWKWQDWRNRALSGGPGATASATRFVSGGLALNNPKVQKICRLVEAFLDGDPSAAKTLAILGKHGTGRSTLLMATAQELADRGHEEIYIVDDFARFEGTDLRHVLPLDRKSILLVDDADAQSAFRPVYNALGVIDMVAVGTFSKVRSATSFHHIGDGRDGPIPIADRPTREELDDLSEILNKISMTRSMQRRLDRCNIRSAYRILSGDPPPPELARRLVGLRFEGEPTELAVSILTWCGINDMLIPAPLLGRTLAAIIPENLMPWLQSRPVFDSEGESSALWIEDREVLRLANHQWREDHLFDYESYRDVILRDITALFNSIAPRKRAERLLARQLTRCTPPNLSPTVIDQSCQRLQECIQIEVDFSELLAWSASIPQGESQQLTDLRQDIRTGLTRGDPDLGALISFVVAQTDNRTHSANMAVGMSDDIGIEQWAEVIQLCEGQFGGLLGPYVFSTAIDFIKHHSDSSEILEFKNSAQIIATNLKRRGRADQRQWFRDALIRRLSELPIINAQYLMEMTTRCLMQRRYHLSMKKRWDPPNAGIAMVDDLRSEYEHLLACTDNKVDETTEAVLEALTMGSASDGKADHLWSKLVNLVEYQNPKQLPRVTEQAWLFVRDAWPRIGVSSCWMTAESLLTASCRSGQLEPAYVTEILQLMDAHGFRAQSAVLLLRLLAASAASTESTTAALATEILHAILDSDPQNGTLRATRGWEAYKSALSLSFNGTLSTVDGEEIIETTKDWRCASVVVGSLHRYPIEQRNVDLSNMVSKWRRHRNLHILLFSMCLENDALDLAEGLISDNWQNSANWSIQMARVYAARNSLNRARNIVRASAERSSRGSATVPVLVRVLNSNWPNVHRATNSRCGACSPR
ncbi:hypothetical protein [Nocardia huaxiensis]|uniref:P-loop NTPase n=1 Tax=Nocardia huaxiensis TaxID=2755382 RepID=UPI001E54A42F|nr:hypothetical protein [Nocardia huaxiensis]UFS97323.1 hypothetical protein LPY97_05235 [Nocardia huaxiensis]